MHIRVPAARRAGDSPQMLCHDASCAHTAHQIGAQVAVHGRDNVLGIQGKGGPHRDGLVASLREGRAGDFALIVEQLQTIVDGTREPHPVIKLN